VLRNIVRRIHLAPDKRGNPIVMTFVGHSLLGASLAQATVPAGASWKQWVWIVNVYVLAAFFPDLPLPGWGHARYYFSHSVFVNLALVVLLAIIGVCFRARWKMITYPLIVGAGAAWLSHFPLDAMYNHGHGVAIYWPFSEAVLNLPLPWFVTLDMQRPFTALYNVRVFLVEALFYLPLLAAACWGRRIWLRRRRTRPSAAG
jgi:hypothetical protein